MAILIVDDDHELCQLLRQFLEREQLEVAVAHDGAGGLRRMLTESFDLVVLDVMLPHLDGFEVLRAARKQTHVPVILLTARGGHDDRLQGFDAGADDYLAKPFVPSELLARIRAILRRAMPGGHFPTTEYRSGSLRIEPAARRAWKDGVSLELTGTEFEILELLVRSAGRIVARNEIFAVLYQREGSPFERTIDVHVSHLRRKLGDQGQRLQTIRGVGYRFRP